MSISLIEGVDKAINVHSFDEDFFTTNPEKHTTSMNAVTIYLLLNSRDVFGMKQPVLRDTVINLKKEEDTMYRYLQHQNLENPSRFGGWIYADELDINKLLRKEEE